ncbi:hypothetical protein BAE44_0021660 [Dichanthelium oligosanthes]|uniref:TOD1/MUCI70 glycosyltransferase-like domain-containing protein n=1 Tax=Dichanthelium oligosanthes TaxID=888268 RepID=A0A1E5UWS1_9POAL|nr:hypothetical protein BAE44_0021660 [Dichanthelium oligosanthes]
MPERRLPITAPAAAGSRRHSRRLRRRCRLILLPAFVLALLCLAYLFFSSHANLPFHDAPCEIQFLTSVDDLVEPAHYENFTRFSLNYILNEEVPDNGFFEPLFGGHQSLQDREETYHAKDQTLHCGFVRGPDDYPSTGFDLDENDRRYSIWLDSKLRPHADPMLIIEYFLWRKKAEYAISMHYDRSCVWEEVLQNKRLNKYNHAAIDEQFRFYQSDGLVKFNDSSQLPVLPSYVPEGSFIVRAHTPMSNLFSCLWFNEVNRFTSRDQLSFTYTYLKLRRTNPGKPFHLNMFKDCERRAIAKLFHHRTNKTTDPPPAYLRVDKTSIQG